MTQNAQPKRNSEQNVILKRHFLCK